MPSIGKSKSVGKETKFLLIVTATGAVMLASHLVSKYNERENHLAPISENAIPDRIGCDVGCEKLNKFSGWQPYLSRVVEVVRRDFKCKRVDYVNVANDSVIPDNPEFFVVCDAQYSEPGKDGKTYTKSFFRKSIDIQYRNLNL